MTSGIQAAKINYHNPLASERGVRFLLMQMKISDLKIAIENLPDDLPVFFLRIAPICGNIEEAGSANVDTFSAFGIVSQCLIIRPMSDEG